MTLYTETDGDGAQYIVSSSGNTECRVKLDRHEREELKQIVDDFGEVE